MLTLDIVSASNAFSILFVDFLNLNLTLNFLKLGLVFVFFYRKIAPDHIHIVYHWRWPWILKLTKCQLINPVGTCIICM